MKTLVYKDITYTFEQIGSTSNGATVRFTISAPMPVFNPYGISVVFGDKPVEDKLFYARYVDGNKVYAYPDKRDTHIDGRPASAQIVEGTRDAKQQTGTKYTIDIFYPIDRGLLRYREVEVPIFLSENASIVVKDTITLFTNKIKETILHPIRYEINQDELKIYCSYDNNDNYFSRAQLFIDNIYDQNFTEETVRSIVIDNSLRGQVKKVHFHVESRDGIMYKSEDTYIAIPAPLSCFYRTANGWIEVDKIFYCPSIIGVYREISNGEYNTGRWSTLSK